MSRSARHRRRRLVAAAGATLGAAFLTACLAAPPAVAGMPSQEGLQELVQNRQKITRKLLAVDPQHEAAFEAVYAEYEAERVALGRERNGIADDFSKAALSMPDEQANGLLDRFLRLRRQRIELDEKFRPRFAAVIGPQKTLLLFQLNFILDAVVHYDLAGMIQLVH